MSTNESTSLTVAFWNTWLLCPQLWEGGPRVLRGKFAPDVERRAPLIGEAVAGHFDIAAFGEAFEEPELRAIEQAARGRTLVRGPKRARRRFTSSGLATLVDDSTARVVASNRHAYRADGDPRDSDTFATKGALHVRVQVGENGPLLDVVSTHLFAGGGFFSGFGAMDSRRHHGIRMRQLRELVDFTAQHRSPEATLLLVGDFNVCANDPFPELGSPTERYDEMVDLLRPLEVIDVWAARGVGLGHTCTFTDAADLPADPSEPDAVADVDDGSLDPLTAPGERIDYLWFSPPSSGSAPTLGRPRRWAFPGRSATGGPAGSLSDHLALSVSLTW